MRTFEEPTLLRRLTQGNRIEPKASSDHGIKNGGLVRLQTFAHDAVLRRDPRETAVVRGVWLERPTRIEANLPWILRLALKNFARIGKVQL